MEVLCKAGNGDQVAAIFEAEESPPHGITGIQLEARPPGGGGEGERMPPAGPRLTDAELVAKAREHLDARALAHEFSGVAMIVRGEKTLLANAWGESDREKHTAATLATRFNIGSIGKMFTRSAIAQLAEAGKLSLDDKLAKYLPDFPHADEITLDMLCEHQSGVGDFFNDKYDAMDRAKLRHNRDYLELIRDQPLWFAPGTSQRYSNGGYALLGEVIAKTSGEDYYDYLAKHVFAPAGMTATGAPIEGDGTNGLARGYTREGAAPGKERDNVATRPARGSAAGGLYSNAADLLAFDRALLAGKLMSLGWAGWVTGEPRPHGVSGTAGGSPRAFGFAGGAPGIAAEWLHEGDAVMILLTNRDPEVTRATAQPLRQLLRRAGGPAKKVRS
jgi:CubicO group peptidase (beta-lactamase class C family)